MKNQLDKIERMVSFLYKKEVERVKKSAAKKSDGIYVSQTDIQEVFNAYKQIINNRAKMTSVSMGLIRQAIKSVGKESLIAVIAKKSKDKFFMEGKNDSGYVANSQRGIGWFCKNKARLNEWLEITEVKTEVDWYKQKTEEFLKRNPM